MADPLDFDLHVHTSEHSACAQNAATYVLSLAEEQGLHGIVFTEHHYCWTDDEIDALREKTGTSLVILAGQEITLAGIDFLVFGWSGNDPKVQTIAQFVDLVQDEGGVVCVAHPWSALYNLDTDRMAEWGVDGVEVANSLKGVAPAEELQKVRRHGLAEVAGSDFHQPVFRGGLGNCYTRFTFPVLTIRDLVRAIRHRKVEAVQY
jgi:predicted metal-dependent phosphoesterase TrpH